MDENTVCVETQNVQNEGEKYSNHKQTEKQADQCNDNSAQDIKQANSYSEHSESHTEAETKTQADSTDSLNGNSSQTSVQPRKSGRARIPAKRRSDDFVWSTLPSHHTDNDLSCENEKSPLKTDPAISQHKRKRCDGENSEPNHSTQSLTQDSERSPPAKKKRGRPPKSSLDTLITSPVKKTLDLPPKKKAVDPVWSPSTKVSTVVEVNRTAPREKKKNTLITTDENFSSRNKPIKRCDKSSCVRTVPICFARASERCSGSGYTSRWHHMSAGEHYCNDCFEHFYRSYKSGYEEFTAWKRGWSSAGKSEATIKLFLSDSQMPYWVQCVKCQKWRQLSWKTEMTPSYIFSFQCGMNSAGIKKEGNATCSIPEDSRITETKQSWWITSLCAASFLHNSPAAPFLNGYYPDGVGLSALCPDVLKIRQRELNSHTNGDASNSANAPHSCQASGDCANVQPFCQPDEVTKALCLNPSVMDEDELLHFPHYARDQQSYLGLRNTVLALWALNSKEHLTVDKCIPHVICRGLARVRGCEELPHIISYLSEKGIINSGLLLGATYVKSECNSEKKESVLVIGAGAAGLAAAHRLHCHGYQVTVLEARDRIGGRVWDDDTLGVCIGKGAHIVNGCINNPISLICHQAGLKMRKITDICRLFDENGQEVNSHVDRRIDFHFNAMLDNVAEWRKHKTSSHDINLLDKIRDMHKQFLEESQLKFSEEEESVLQFHFSNLEYACGCPLDKVSSLNWDQNETYEQFGGGHTLMVKGYTPLLNKLSEGLDVRLSTTVIKIDYSDNGVTVYTKDNQELKASKVVVTVPLALLQKEVIDFIPSLPESKMKAIRSLGAGIIEKVALQFSHRFWDKKVKGADFFGHVCTHSETRGLFSVFYDMASSDDEEKPAVLTSYLSGESVKIVHEKSDEEIVAMCVTVLKKLFSEEDVPNPSRYLVTRWSSDTYSQMAYSYVPVGCRAEEYDEMAACVQDKLYFAGEATNRKFPQTVTGAYLSGIREADKIITPSSSLSDSRS